jgi:hypothetical protein
MPWLKTNRHLNTSLSPLLTAPPPRCLSTSLGSNDAPKAQSIPTLPDGSEDTDYTISETDLLAGFTDPEGENFQRSQNLTTTNGILSGPVGGVYTFTPDETFTGTVELTYQVVDDLGASTDATQSFTIAAVNDAPTNLFSRAIVIPEQGTTTPCSGDSPLKLPD